MTFSEDHPQLIAHRGYSERYPENTLVGLEAALRAGTDCIEFDVQFTKDRVPIVIHDNDLSRTTGVSGKASQLTIAQLSNIKANEGRRFDNQFSHEPIPTLNAVLELLKQWPGVTAFVEIKKEAIDSFGIEPVVQRLASELLSFGEKCVLISSHIGVPGHARKLGFTRVGWVIPRWDEPSRKLAQSLVPDVLFCDYKKIPDLDGVLWPGPWRWALYDIVDPDKALCWIRRGAMFIESWDVGRLLRDQQLVSCLGRNTKKT